MANIKVIGIGPPRTGTTTLKAALKTLGFVPGNESDPFATCLVGDGVCLPYDRFKELDNRYPEAKFIYTHRKDPNTWLESVIRRTDVIKDNEGVLRQRKRMYGSREVDPELYLLYYNKRLADVHEYFWDKYGDDTHTKIRFLCWENGDEWPQLCNFLHRPPPSINFPHKNKSK